MAIKSFADIAKLKESHKLRVNQVRVEELGATFYLREMDAEAMSAFFDIENNTGKFSVKQAAAVIVLHLCDREGNLLVAPDRRKDEAAVLESGFRMQVITTLFTECLRVSGLSTEEVAEAAKK